MLLDYVGGGLLVPCLCFVLPMGRTKFSIKIRMNSYGVMLPGRVWAGLGRLLNRGGGGDCPPLVNPLKDCKQEKY